MEETDNGEAFYKADIRETNPGEYEYKIRILPFNPLFRHKHETGLVKWAQGENKAFKVLDKQETEMQRVKNMAYHDAGTILQNFYLTAAPFFEKVAPPMNIKQAFELIEKLRLLNPDLADSIDFSEDDPESVNGLIGNYLFQTSREINNLLHSYFIGSSTDYDPLLLHLQNTEDLINAYFDVVPASQIADTDSALEFYSFLKDSIGALEDAQYFLHELSSGTFVSSDRPVDFTSKSLDWIKKRRKAIKADLLFTGDHDIPSPVKINPIHVKRIVSNLLTNTANALKDYPEKPDSRVEINYRINLDNNTVTLTYTDNAGGIPDDIMPHIFDFGFTTKQTDTGIRGIGLYSVKRMIQLAGGTIQAASNPGESTTFTINLPLSTTPESFQDEKTRNIFAEIEITDISESFIETNHNNLFILAQTMLNRLPKIETLEAVPDALTFFSALNKSLWEDSVNPDDFAENISEETIKMRIGDPVFVKIMLNVYKQYVSYSSGQWRKLYQDKFSAVSILTWNPVVTDQTFTEEDPIVIESTVDLGELKPEDVKIQIWHGINGQPGWKATEMSMVKRNDNSTYLFSGELIHGITGRVAFKPRIVFAPGEPLISSSERQILWADGSDYIVEVTGSSETDASDDQINLKSKYDLRQKEYDLNTAIYSLKLLADRLDIMLDDQDLEDLRNILNYQGNLTEYPYPAIVNALRIDNQPVSKLKLNLLREITAVLQDRMFLPKNRTENILAGILGVFIKSRIKTLSSVLSAFHKLQNDKWAFIESSSNTVKGLSEQTSSQTEIEVILNSIIADKDDFVSGAHYFKNGLQATSSIQDSKKAAIFDFDLAEKDGFAGLKDAFNNYESFFTAIGFFSDTYSEKEMKDILQKILGEILAEKLVLISVEEAIEGDIFSVVVNKALSNPVLEKLSESNLILVGEKSRRQAYGTVPSAKTFFADRFSTFAQIVVSILYADNSEELKAALQKAGFSEEEIAQLAITDNDIPPTPDPNIQNFMKQIDSFEKARKAIAAAA